MVPILQPHEHPLVPLTSFQRNGAAFSQGGDRGEEEEDGQCRLRLRLHVAANLPGRKEEEEEKSRQTDARPLARSAFPRVVLSSSFFAFSLIAFPVITGVRRR